MIRIGLVFLLGVVPLLADSDFDALVKNLEARYGVRKQYVPMLGFANFMVKMVRPAGTHDLKLAILDNIDNARHPEPEQLDEMVRPGGWKPFIRVVSNRQLERVYVYARERSRDHELLVATLENNEAVLVRVRLNAEGLARWVNNPVVMGRSRPNWNSD
jgi:hypothetical protein